MCAIILIKIYNIVHFITSARENAEDREHLNSILWIFQRQLVPWSGKKLEI
jgi:hypothetical protein